MIRSGKRAGLVIFAIAFLASCGLQTERRTIPPEAMARVESFTADVAADRFEKIYSDAADLWREDSTLDQSTATLKTLKEKLGAVKNRQVHSAREEENASGPLQGRSFTITFQTTFEKDSAMETFTLVERSGQWQVARYRVTSLALG